MLAGSMKEKYDVTFVFIGRLEKDMYGAEVGEGFENFMDVVYDKNGVIIYKVRE